MNVTVRRVLSRALSALPPPGRDPNVYLALSGGVDSSVAAFLLREKGYAIKPILMQCWNLLQESSPPLCFEEEYRAAEEAVESLNLQTELCVVDLVPAYWNDVFQDVMLAGLKAGRSPNVDLACNKYVKFGAFPAYLKRTFDESAIMATGHYSRLQDSPQGTRLLSGIDQKKDQSYFLASVNGKSLERCLMPIGCLQKTEVRLIAEWANLPAAHRRSSRGICFVGKRPFPAFISDFLEGDVGNFVMAECGTSLSKCTWPSWAYTVGQRARIAGQSGRLYVVGKKNADVFVAPEGDWRHYSKAMFCPSVDWITGAPDGLEHGIEIEYKMCSTRRRQPGVIRRIDEKAALSPNAQKKFCSEGLLVSFEQPERRIADGQAIVLYDKDVCLGAAWPEDLREWDVIQQNSNSSMLHVI